MKIHICDVEEGITDAARRLLKEGADPEDKIHAYRGEMHCLTATVGKAALLYPYGTHYSLSPRKKEKKR